MSAITSVTGSDNAAYATQLAQASKLRRSLHSLGDAIDNGDLTSAGATLTGIVKAFPQYAASSGEAAQSQDPINQGFQKITAAISNHDTGAAQAAWTQLKSDLKQAGVSDLSDGKAATAKLLADNKASLNQAIIDSFYNASLGAEATLATLFGAAGASSSTTHSVSAAIGEWLTYKVTGTAAATATAAAAAAAGDKLDTTA